MKYQVFQIKKSRIHSTISQEQTLSLLTYLENPTILYTFKDESKIHVFVFEFKGIKYVYKEPRERNERKWERFLTLFRPSESTRFFKSHIKLLELGLLCPKPIISYDEINWGMTIKSFFVYEFIEGESAYPPHKTDVYSELKKLHQLGYTRRDPNLNNFILNKDGIYFIDFRLNKPIFFSKFKIKTEQIIFNERQPPRIEPTGKLNLPIKKDLSYKLARFYLNMNSSIGKLKGKLKALIKYCFITK